MISFHCTACKFESNSHIVSNFIEIYFTYPQYYNSEINYYYIDYSTADYNTTKF